MSYLMRRWERVARREGRLAEAEVVLGLWLCTPQEQVGDELAAEWVRRVRRASVRSFGTRSSALVLTSRRLWIIAPRVQVPAELAHLGVVRTVLPKLVRCEVLIPAPVSIVGLSMANRAEAEAAATAIEAARTAAWQGFGSSGHQQLRAQHGTAVADELRARWLLADPSRGAQPAAAVTLGTLLAGRGHAVEAEALLRAAMAGPDDSIAAEAALELGQLLRDAGELESARQAYDQALDSPDLSATCSARYQLGSLSAKAGDLVRAEDLLSELADENDPVWTPIALTKLAAVRKAAGDQVGAEAAFRGAIATGHENLAPASTVELARMLVEQGRTDEAASLYAQAVATGHQRHSLAATLDLGNLARMRGDLAGARAAFRSVADGVDDKLARIARQRLQELRTSQEAEAAGGDASLHPTSQKPDQGT